MGVTIGKYRVLASLGQGGMAEVHLVVVEGPAGSGFTKLQVVKSLRPNLAVDDEFVRMFLDEARLAARVNHPNIVQTYEIGEASGKYFIAMEYLDGQPLNMVLSRLKRKGRLLDTRLFLSVLCDVLAGLHHAHELRDYDGQILSVVHRDVTPHNIFLTYEGHAKVVDFGIAKAARRSVETQGGVIKGKVPYMPPEQVTGEPVDRRADIFAVGTMIWEAATGRRLWEKEDHVNILRRLIAGDVPRSPKTIRPDIDDELDAICAKALAPDAAKRYATAQELMKALDAYLLKHGGRASPAELSELMLGLFADKRAEVKALIEQQLSNLSKHSFNVIRLAENSTQSQNDLVAPVEPGRTPFTAASGSLVTASSETTARRSGRRVPIIGAAIGGLAIAILASTLIARPWQSQASGKSAQPSPSAQPPPSAQPSQIALSFAVSPSNAEVFLDGDGPFPPNHVAHVPADRAQHSVRVAAPGFQQETRVVRADVDQTLTLALAQTPTDAKTAGRSAGAKAPTPARPTNAGGGAPARPAGPSPKTVATTPPSDPPEPPTPSRPGPKHVPDQVNPFGN